MSNCFYFYLYYSEYIIKLTNRNQIHNFNYSSRNEKIINHNCNTSNQSANLSAQDRYSVSNDIEIDVLSGLLDWDESKVEYKSTPSVDTTQTSTCTYSHENEVLEVRLVETDYIGYSSEDGNFLKIAEGSYDDDTGEITFEYYQTKGYYSIAMSYTTTKSYKVIKGLMNEIADLLELNQTVSNITTYRIGN